MDITQPAAFLRLHVVYMQRLVKPPCRGFSLRALTVMHMRTQRAYKHILRAIPVSQWWANEVDGQVVAAAQTMEIHLNGKPGHGT